MCANAFYSDLGAKHNACYVGRQRFLLKLWMIAWAGVVLYELNACLTKLLGTCDTY